MMKTKLGHGMVLRDRKEIQLRKMKRERKKEKEDKEEADCQEATLHIL
jgi:hypothetical protein